MNVNTIRIRNFLFALMATMLTAFAISSTPAGAKWLVTRLTDKTKFVTSIKT